MSINFKNIVRAHISKSSWLGGKTLVISFGGGNGYMNKFWCDLDNGPGNATQPNTPCGHTGLKRCNSCHCTRAFCNLPKVPVIGFFLKGHTFRLWIGAKRYQNTPLSKWWQDCKRDFSYLKRMRDLQREPRNKDLYSILSFR